MHDRTPKGPTIWSHVLIRRNPWWIRWWLGEVQARTYSFAPKLFDLIADGWEVDWEATRADYVAEHEWSKRQAQASQSGER